MDIVEECELQYGKIDKFKIFQENEDGIIKIKFENSNSADKCIDSLNGRYYNTRKIEAFFWDGIINYDKNKENLEIEKARIDEFGKWLENQEDE